MCLLKTNKSLEGGRDEGSSSQNLNVPFSGARTALGMKIWSKALGSWCLQLQGALGVGRFAMSSLAVQVWNCCCPWDVVFQKSPLQLVPYWDNSWINKLWITHNLMPLSSLFSGIAVSMGQSILDF